MASPPPKQRRDTCESCYKDGLRDGDRKCERKKASDKYFAGTSETYEERCARWEYDANGFAR